MVKIDLKRIKEMKSKAFSGMMLIVLIMSILMLVLNVQPVKAPGAIHIGADGWLYRKAHNITGSTEGDQTYYQMKIIVHYGNGADSGENVYLNSHSQTDFDDIRFTWYNSSSGNEVECDYWLEEKHDQDKATFWVEIPEINNVTNNTIYIYYGNSTVSTTSNGDNTFLFFDHFLGTSIDTNKWEGSTARASVSGSICTLSGEAPESDLIGKTKGPPPRVMRCLGQIQSGSVWSALGMRESPSGDAMIQILNAAQHGKLIKQSTENTAGTTTETITSFTTDSFVIFEIFWTAGQCNYFEEGTELSGSPLSTNVPADNLGAELYAGYSGQWVKCDWILIRKYVSPEPSQGDWGSEEILGPYIVIDRAFVSDERADVGSVQTIGFHAKWDNNSDVVGGEIYVNGTKYITNNAGWIFFDEVSSVVDRKTWIVTGVNCNGVTVYIQTAPTPSIVWNRIKIVDGGVTKESVMVGETTTIWFRAIYEYDDVFFEDKNGVLYINRSEMSWSKASRWEFNYTATAHGLNAFIITGVSDSLYGLAVINDPIGAQIITVLGQPTLTVSLDTSTSYVGYKVKISGKLSYPIGTGISGSKLLLTYSVTGGESWNDITSVTTTAEGDYFVEWMPTATGNYLVRVSWEGNETLYVAGTEVYSTLAVIPVEGKYVFSVISNSTVSELAFNSTSRVLSFTVSGSSGTMGYTKVTIAKTLIGDINELKVYLDGNQISYAVVSTEDSFLLDFTYQHSTHEVVVSLGPPPFIPPQLITSLSLCILAITLAVATAILIFKIRKGTPTTMLDSVLK